LDFNERITQRITTHEKNRVGRNVFPQSVRRIQNDGVINVTMILQKKLEITDINVVKKRLSKEMS